MRYDFESIIDRNGKDALACEVIPFNDFTVKNGFSKIPMWVADMNFETVPSVKEAIISRAAHGLYGYFQYSKEYYDAIINWQKLRNGVTVEKENIGYENGVLGGVSSALHVLCSKGDSVLIHSPTYIGFTSVLKANGYNIVHSPLIVDENNVWRMDFEDMEAKIKANNIHTAIFCSPHNPSGRVWERWEIESAMEIFKRNDVYVISDEIWSDITLFNNKHIPTQSVSEDAKMRTVAIYAPSKTFNLAGLIGSYRIVYNPWLRHRIEKEAELSHYNHMNLLSLHALVAAYSNEGMEWTDQLKVVLSENIDYAYSFINENFKGIKLSKPQGTYMLFLDCTEWCKANNTSLDELLRKGVEVGVIWQDGRAFNGSCHIRMNLAHPLSVVKDALDRLNKYVFK